MRGYAPIGKEREIIAGVEAGATYFEALAGLQSDLALVGVGGMLLILLISVGVAQTIVRPVRRLAAAASTIGEGDYDTQISVRAGAELGTLANAMEEMRSSVVQRDRRLWAAMRSESPR